MPSKIKPMYQPWNEDDFQGDLFVRRMDGMSRWMYRTLLQAAYTCSTRPYLPSEDSKLWVLSGCDDEKIWQKHKDKVLPMFEVVEKNGSKLYARKRVVDDWQKLQKIILTNKKNAKNGWAKRKDATALPPHSESDATPIQVKLREVKISKEKKSEEEEKMRKENYRVLCLKIGLKADPDNSGSWRDLRDMCEAFGDDKVLSQFENWISENPGVRFPVSVFVKELPSLLQAPGLKTRDEGLDNLAISLYKIGGSVFTGKSLTALGELRTEFSDKEITQAWQVFVGDEADSFPSNWPKKFTEGAGRILIKTIRAENTRRVETEKALEAQTRKDRAEYEAERARIEAEKAQEKESVDELMRELGGQIQ